MLHWTLFRLRNGGRGAKFRERGRKCVSVCVCVCQEEGVKGKQGFKKKKKNISWNSKIAGVDTEVDQAGTVAGGPGEKTTGENGGAIASEQGAQVSFGSAVRKCV